MKITSFVFSILGLLGLTYIINDYGVSKLHQDILLIGFFNLVLLSFTFIPTLICYSLSWELVTEGFSLTLFKGKFCRMKRTLFFIKSMTISIAWNNLTPFFKVAGEPVKAVLLSSYIPVRLSIKSTILYNIIHIIGTILSFVILSILIPVVFNIPSLYKVIFLSASIICILSLLPFFFFPLETTRKWGNAVIKKFPSSKKIKKIILKILFSISQLTYFYKKNALRIFLAIFLEVIARFIEGITFYFTFKLLGNHISIFTAAILDVGRTLIDTIFFFIPYQIGGRESGVKFLMQNILLIDSKGYLFAVLAYRLVEIFWVIVGYIFWVARSLK
ncbi:MAG: hypothetical protein HQK51_10595 [Oligoflexia bacterium]|nr:hypothetical protein [Oligoflexia bacterium]